MRITGAGGELSRSWKEKSVIMRVWVLVEGEGAGGVGWGEDLLAGVLGEWVAASGICVREGALLGARRNGPLSR
jgi:hypothetical protein